METRGRASVRLERLEAMADMLAREADLYGELVGLARSKQKMLVDGEIASLESILVKERDLLRTISQVEEDRYALQCDLASDLDLSPGDLTVGRLADLAGPAYGALLRERQQRLAGLIQELSAVNQCNAELISQALAYVDFTLEALAGAGETVGYERSGRRQGTRGRRLLDGRA